MAFKLFVVLALVAAAQATGWGYPNEYSNDYLKAWDVADKDLENIDRSAAYDVGASDDRNINYKTFNDDGDSDLYNEYESVTDDCGINSLRKRAGDVRSSRKGATTYGAGSNANSWKRGLNIDRSARLNDDSDRGVIKGSQRVGGKYLPRGLPVYGKKVLY